MKFCSRNTIAVVIIVAFCVATAEADICSFRHCTACGKVRTIPSVAARVSAATRLFCDELYALPDCCHNFTVSDMWGTTWHRYM